MFKGRRVRRGAAGVTAAEWIAVKRATERSEERAAAFEREASFLRELSGEHGVVQLLKAFVRLGRAHLCLELCHLDVHVWLAASREPPPEEAAEHFAAQLLGAVEAVHERGVAHRDIKPKNVLLKKCPAAGGAFPYVVKLADFGMAQHISSTDLAICGTPSNMAPEMALKLRYEPQAVDAYSCGTVLYQVLTKIPPVRASSVQELQLKLQTPPEPLPYPARTASCIKEVTNGLLRREPARRLSVHRAREMLRHESGYVVVNRGSNPEAADTDARVHMLLWAAQRARSAEDRGHVLCWTQRTGVESDRLSRAVEGVELPKVPSTEPLEALLLEPLRRAMRAALSRGQDAVADAVAEQLRLLEDAEPPPTTANCSTELGEGSCHPSNGSITVQRSDPIAIPARASQRWAHFCYKCGARFTGDDRTCVCGSPRHTL